MAPDDERERVLRTWNDTQRTFAWEGALHERFEAWAARCLMPWPSSTGGKRSPTTPSITRRIRWRGPFERVASVPRSA